MYTSEGFHCARLGYDLMPDLNRVAGHTSEPAAGFRREPLLAL